MVYLSLELADGILQGTEDLGEGTTVLGGEAELGEHCLQGSARGLRLLSHQSEGNGLNRGRGRGICSRGRGRGVTSRGRGRGRSIVGRGRRGVVLGSSRSGESNNTEELHVCEFNVTVTPPGYDQKQK
jgi:hypothetical protein